MRRDTLQANVSELERMVYDIKTSTTIPSLLRIYYYSISSSSLTPGLYTITYAAGKQPIITNIWSSAGVELGQPNETSQSFACYSQGSAGAVLISTRPIVSVAKNS